MQTEWHTMQTVLEEAVQYNQGLHCLFRHILAYQTRFSAIFTSADKSYLASPYPTCGIDNKPNNKVLSIHWLYRRKALGVDVLAMSLYDLTG